MDRLTIVNPSTGKVVAVVDEHNVVLDFIEVCPSCGMTVNPDCRDPFHSNPERATPNG